jgi:UDP-N-acetylmuramoyl-tripeptide--D-alanyl-D-alanine ligase
MVTGKIKEFLKSTSGINVISGPIDSLDYTNVSIDSRTLKPGQLFIPLKGDNFDGHKFVSNALKKGASGVVTEKEWYQKNQSLRLSPNETLICADDPLKFLQKLSAWHRRQYDFPLIGLTGSNGKTTCRKMIYQILSNDYDVLSNTANQNNHIGVPLTLLRTDAEHSIGIVELGTNHPGEIAFLCELVKPTAGIITNIGKGHLGYFGDLKEVYREKTMLYNSLPSGSPIFVNMDDPYLKNYIRDDLSKIRVGISTDCHVYGAIISTDRWGALKFSINDNFEVQLKIPGKHHFYNALLSAAVGIYYGISTDKIKHSLEAFLPESQRMEISERDGLIIINDAYNANPDSTKAAIDYLVTLPVNVNKKILVLGDMLEMGEFGEKEHLEIGQYIDGNKIDYVFLYGPLSKYIQVGINESKSNAVESFWYDSHQNIANHLNDIINTGDVLLIKGSRGMKMENVLENLNKV